LVKDQELLFDEIYSSSGGETADSFSNIKFLESIPEVKGPVLEIGCGRGYVLSYLHKSGFEAVGIELSEEAIKQAEKDYPEIDIRKAIDPDRLPFEDAFFQTIVSFDVLEHFLSVDSHLKEVSRVLKVGGIYAFQTPNILTNLPKEIIFRGSYKKAREFHPSVQSYSGLRNKLKKNNFTYTFYKMPLISPEKFGVLKERSLGWKIAVNILKVIPQNTFPFRIRPNFWVVAKKYK
jgi:2-polyprenyl-3-methyl-5-hydroxy-6-metoxy-1,4-benzoquinol methylase